MKFVGNLWAFMFKTKNLASVSHCARKLQCRKNTIDEIATPKRDSKKDTKRHHSRIDCS